MADGEAAAALPINPATSGDAPMSLVDHLTELRRRIVRSLIAIALGGAVGFWFGNEIVAFLKAPLPIEQPLVFTAIGDPFAIRLRIAIVAGIILAMPVILYQGWAFVSPGLTPAERRAARPWIPLALAFFALGVAIAYAVLPFAAQFLLSFTTTELQPLLTAREYFDFVSTLILAFGLLMEIPIVLVGLARIGVVTSARLRAARRMVILGIAIFSAAATPGGDLVSPAVLGLSLYLLYELAIILIRRGGR